jgi:hypothetical protein
MIPKIEPRGKSFAGLATYLTHDPKEKTDDRVAWTHTLNLAHDHVPSAVDEMLWTARAAELLKQEAGIRAGGRSTENPVKHFSLNWSPEDNPTREHMIETAEDFLRHMKWHEHQALLVAHDDKEHAHVHVMLNAVHPETGLRLNEDFEHKRAQAWALEYEQTHGRIYCEQRLLDPEAREDAMTRPIWMAFQEKEKEFTQREKVLENQSDIILENKKSDPNIANFAEWKKLKEIQRDERETFFAEGKLVFSELRRSINREVREEFRERWSDYYAAEKDGMDATLLKEMKKQLIAEQQSAVIERRDAACLELRETRDGQYRELLTDQRDIRHQLRSRQENGFENDLFLQLIDDRDAGKDRLPSFREAAEEVTARQEKQSEPETLSFTPPHHHHERTGFKSGTDIGANIASGLGFGFLSFFEGLADGLVPSKPAPKVKQPEPETRSDPFALAVVEKNHEREQRERDEADEDWRRKQRSAGE